MLSFYLSLIDDDELRIKFAAIYKTYRKQMVLTALSFLKNSSDAEDAVHDVFFQIVACDRMDFIQKFKNPADLRNYLLKAVKNTALNMLKREYRKELHFDSDISEDAEEILELTDNDFLSRICAKFEYEDLVDAILSLNERYRDTMYYHFVMDLSIPETAKALGKEISTTKMQLVRGKKLLMKAFAHEESLDNNDCL